MIPGPIGTIMNLLIVLAVAKMGGLVFEKLKLPAVIGEVAAGVLVGPSALGLVNISPITDAVAAFGVMVLLFGVGLETNVADLREVGREASLVAVTGIVLPFALVYTLLHLLGSRPLDTLFISTAAVATSVGITARVLSDLGAIKRVESRVILGAAVLDDILGLLILSAVITYARAHVLSGLDLLLVAFQVVAFLVFAAAVAPWLVRRHVSLAKKLGVWRAPLVVGLLAMLGLAALSESVGLAAIVGAFFAGMILAETEDHRQLSRDIRPLVAILVPVFFAVTGARLDLSAFGHPGVLAAGFLITACAALGKVLGGLSVVPRLGFPRALAVGVGMVPRGEVGLIVASVGLSMGVVSPAGVSQVVLMSVLTTLIVPPLLPVLFRRTA